MFCVETVWTACGLFALFLCCVVFGGLIAVFVIG